MLPRQSYREIFCVALLYFMPAAFAISRFMGRTRTGRLGSFRRL